MCAERLPVSKKNSFAGPRRLVLELGGRPTEPRRHGTRSGTEGGLQIFLFFPHGAIHRKSAVTTCGDVTRLLSSRSSVRRSTGR
jgi:hypothetical protein